VRGAIAASTEERLRHLSEWNLDLLRTHHGSLDDELGPVDRPLAGAKKVPAEGHARGSPRREALAEDRDPIAKLDVGRGDLTYVDELGGRLLRARPCARR
jgi:hypothetical protein